MFTSATPRAHALVKSLLGDIGGCSASFFASIGIAKLFGAFGGEVPILDDDTNAKEQVLDCAAWVIGNILIDTITRSMVNWINSGFDGNPAFETNLKRSLNRAGQEAAAVFISETDFSKVCSPFRLQLRIALLQRRRLNRISCSLDRVTRNIDNFIGGDFTDGGWVAWYSLTQTPANNPYGAYLLTSGALDRLVEERRGEERDLLKFGSGFKSFRECSFYWVCEAGPPDPNFVGPPDPLCPNGVKRLTPADEVPDPEADNVLVCAEHEILTPGDVIDTQLNEVLTIGGRRLTIADEVNEIVSALMRFLLDEIFSDGGGGLRNVNVDEVADRDISGGDGFNEFCDDFPNLEICSDDDGGGPPPPGQPPPPSGGITQCFESKPGPSTIVLNNNNLLPTPWTVTDHGGALSCPTSNNNQIGPYLNDISFGLTTGNSYNKMTVEFDFLFGGFDTTIPRSEQLQVVFGIQNVGEGNERPDRFMNFLIRPGRAQIRGGENAAAGGSHGRNVNLVAGTTYRVRLDYDATLNTDGSTGSMTVSMTDGAGVEVVSIPMDIAYSVFPAGNGTFIEFGGGFLPDCVVPLFGSTYSNAVVTLEPGSIPEGPVCAGLNFGSF